MSTSSQTACDLRSIVAWAPWMLWRKAPAARNATLGLWEFVMSIPGAAVTVLNINWSWPHPQ